VQAAAVLGEIAAVDPSEYERQQNASGEKAGVRSVATFIKRMAEQMPKWVVGGGEGAVEWLKAGRQQAETQLAGKRGQALRLC
jgi:hypothetical protein